MKMEDYLKGESTAVRRCPIRKLCPIGALCESMTSKENEYPLRPALVDIDRGQLVWTDPYSEQHVYVMRSGAFACMSSLEDEREVPFGLYGPADMAGLGELYIKRETGKSYYLRALTDAAICSFPAKALRRQLESVRPAYALSVMSAALTNVSSAAYVQAKTTTRPMISERIAIVLLRLRALAEREQRHLREIGLTHEDLATLTCADRASVTRALHKLEEEGFIQCGYRSIRLNNSLDACAGLKADATARFHVPDAPLD